MCGIFGIYPHKDASKLTYLGLYSLQHRGEESAGIVSNNGKKIFLHKAMGLVSDVFSERSLLDLRGDLAVGHVCYSTTGSSNAKNIQPFLVRSKIGNIAIAHNGNLINALSLRKKMEEQGSIFQTTMDSEVISHLLAHSPKKEVKDAMVWALGQLQGAYSLVLMVDDMIVGARDTFGWRPLCLGKFDGAYILTSETCALDLIGAEYIRDIEPGELIFIHKDKVESVKPFLRTPYAFCIFELIYFARPDSNIFNCSVYNARKALGEQLGREFPVEADIVMPIPDSGTSAALGFSKATGITYETGLIRNHYIGRTFIQPSQLLSYVKVMEMNP